MIFSDRLKKIEALYLEAEKTLSDPEVIKDQPRFQKLTKEFSELKPIVEGFRELSRFQKEADDLQHHLDDPAMDSEMRGLYEEEIKLIRQKITQKKYELEELLLSEADPHSGRDVIVEIRAGTGGNEATLFAADLFRMYTKYAAAQGLKIEVINSNTTGVGGFKEISFGVSGSKAYPLFKFEMGIHRVQRVPVTESSGRIHTSAVTVAVLPEVDESEVEIDPKDLRIDVFRASGAGGQHVNKTESAVRITHLPTGLVVNCQDERSQHKNRAKAMRVLRARLYEVVRQKQMSEIAKQRKEQVGTGDRSGKIRTYNFPDQRVTDHRIGLTLHSLDAILDGHLDLLLQALERDERERRLTDAA